MGTSSRVGGAAVALALTLTAAGCFGPPAPDSAPPPPAPAPAAAPGAKAPPLPEQHVTYPVGLRILHLHRGRNRPLPTLVFYPAVPARRTNPAADNPTALETPAGQAAQADRSRKARTAAKSRKARTAAKSRKARTAAKSDKARTAAESDKARSAAKSDKALNADMGTTAGKPRGRNGETWKAREPARGRFPVVLFSHGLSGSAERYADALATWAAAGFVVAAPTFPYTSEFTDDFRRPDIVNQPADARYVLSRVQRLNYTPGDPLWHRMDTDHMAAVGHSAGGYTTTGLFTAGHDPRLRSGIVMAGWAAKGAFAGPPANLLFLQGKADPIVRVASSRALYARVPWPKSYLLMRRDSHATYLRPGDIGYDVMNTTVISFLRWTLEDDEAARRDLPPTAYPAPAHGDLPPTFYLAPGGLTDLAPDRTTLAGAN
jgi:dienelactone hydrolase